MREHRPVQKQAFCCLPQPYETYLLIFCLCCIFSPQGTSLLPETGPRCLCSRGFWRQCHTSGPCYRSSLQSHHQGIWASQWPRPGHASRSRMGGCKGSHHRVRALPHRPLPRLHPRCKNSWYREKSAALVPGITYKYFYHREQHKNHWLHRQLGKKWYGSKYCTSDLPLTVKRS